MKNYIIKLNRIFTNSNVCKSHGTSHALSVLSHSKKALRSQTHNLNHDQELSVYLASLLHDADDSKFFPTHVNNDNLINIINDQPTHIVDLTIQMVNLVASSKNANNIPPNVMENEWMLIPRFSDRLEAVGLIGVERCFQYNGTKNEPLYLENTPKAKSEEELWKIATIERYNMYSGNSVSMMDHYYDKLIRLGLFNTSNQYLLSEGKRRTRPIIDFALYFGNKQIMTRHDVIQWINNARKNNIYPIEKN